MSEFLFVLKTLAFTAVLLFLMQIKVGHRTLEGHTTGWMRESVAVNALRGVANGAVVVAENAGVFAMHFWDEHVASSGAKAGAQDHSRGRMGTQFKDAQYSGDADVD